MIKTHYLIYTKRAEEERQRMDISDIAAFRLSRTHRGGRIFKVFKNWYIFRPQNCKRNRDDGIMNNVYIVTHDDHYVVDIAKRTISYQDVDPSRVVRVRLNTRDMSISTKTIFNKEEPWETL